MREGQVLRGRQTSLSESFGAAGGLYPGTEGGNVELLAICTSVACVCLLTRFVC